MIYFVNILTIIFAAIVALQIANEKRKYLSSVALIFMGIIYHIIEAYINYKSGECTYIEKSNFITAIDSCINYESGSMFFAQAFIIGGFTVIFVSYVVSKKPNK